MKNKRSLIYVLLVVAILVLGLIICLINFNKKMETYEVAFVMDDGDIISTQIINEGEKAIKPNDPQKEGYIFLEWTYEDEIYDFSQEVVSNLILKAKWQKLQEDIELFKVEFDSDGGTTISNKVVEKGNKVEMPEKPIKEGYIFKGWTLNGEEYNFELEIMEDLTLKAKWEKINNNLNVSKDTQNNTTSNSPNNNQVDDNNGDSKDNQIQNENLPEAPTLSIPAGSPGYAQLNIRYEGAYANGTDLISGYELYEKIGNQYKMIHTSETQFSTEVTVDVGESRIFVARVYEYNKSNVKVYSAYSNEVEVGYLPEAPTLSIPAGSPGYAQLNINYEGAYANGTDLISGYELYEKIGNQYKMIHTSETQFSTDVTVDVGESRIFVARVYKYNKSNVKVYSGYSNEVEVGYLPEAPTLSIPAGSPGYAQLNINYEGAYANGTDLISGYELYEKIGNQYKMIHTSETQFSTEVTVDVGESRIFVARVYKYNKSNVKVYSAYSNEVVVDCK